MEQSHHILRPDVQVNSIQWANTLLHTIHPPLFRASLPEGRAIVFHEEDVWIGYTEPNWK